MPPSTDGPSPPHRVVLLVRDGWGYSANKKGNAIAEAKTPHTDDVMKRYAHCLLSASGETVGLPKGEMGNSEVGHLTMGAGRTEPQELMRIEKSIADGSFPHLKPLTEAMAAAKSEGGKFHLLGLLSDGGVHSHLRHVFALLDALKAAGVSRVFVHAIADGRDTAPTSAFSFIEQLQRHCQQTGVGKLADVIGRHFAMDRDTRWERVHKAFALYTQSEGEQVRPDELQSRLQREYEGGKGSDQTLPPLLLDRDGRMEEGDIVLCFNFRNDRMKEITAALAGRQQREMRQQAALKLRIVTMTQYDEQFQLPVLFPFHPVNNALPEIIAAAGYQQFHCAETEKYAHVTFFFSGGKEEKVKGEERKLVPSPKVETYDLQPAMSCEQVTAALLQAIREPRYAFIVCNLAAADMVGHTGKYDATVAACEAVDAAVGQAVQAVTADSDGRIVLLITGDHGNAEEMLDEKGAVKTSHTTNPVQLVVVGTEFESKQKERSSEGKEAAAQQEPNVQGGLNDIAPTVLELLGIDKPKEMTGRSLLPLLSKN